MTGTILPPTETAMLRGVAKSAAVLFTLMRIEMLYPGRASSVLDIAGILAVDTRTVERHLVKLSAASLVTCQADRWMLTPEGRGTLFGTLRDPHLSIEESEPLLLEPENPAQIVHQIEDRLILNSAKNVKSSSSDQDCTFCADVAQILQAAASLFEAEVMVNDTILRRDPEYVLGWVSKAWNDFTRPGSTLRSPAGLIYKRLCELEPLPVMYQKNPARGLPPHYLHEIGLLTEAQAVIQAKEQEPRPVSYSEGAWSHLISTPETQEYQPFEGWVSINRDMPEIKYVSFHGRERVTRQGNILKVYLSDPHGDRVKIANQSAAEVASKIFGEYINDPAARVQFVQEEK